MQTTRISGAIGTLAAGMLLAFFHLVPAAIAADAPAQPRLASLQIEIWPEFDRPAALVILKGEFAGDIALIPTATIRIPASSGGPSAVAFSTAPGGDLLTMPYERVDGTDFITLRLKPHDRFFHVEFYDPFPVGALDRKYSYTWPGDFAVDRLTLRVQQPATSSNFSITPPIANGMAGPDKLLYWTKEIGKAQAGKALPVEIKYSKNETRTSIELLGLGKPAAAPLAAPQAVSQPAAQGEVLPAWLLATIGGMVILAGALLAWAFWRRRQQPAAAPAAAGFCPQCRNPLQKDDRFCSKCGSAVRQKRRK
jgi:hypothetical protein